MLEKDIKKVLVSHDEIVEAAKNLGETLTKEYQGKNPIFVGILKGSVPFMAELINHVDTHIELDFMLVSSYHGGTASSGIINIIKECSSIKQILLLAHKEVKTFYLIKKKVR